MDFVGRTEELAALRRSWNSPRGEFFVLYGRRRVGKSVLLSQFATEVDRVVFFEAMPTETRDNLTALATELDRLIDDPLSSPIDSWQAAFAAIGRLADSAPLLIVIDEFQYVARKEPAVGSLINRLIESRADQSNLMLVVSGSDVSFFHHEVMGYAATTYGRRTAALKLRPFEFSEAQAFMPNLNLAERVRAYAVFGGMPYYLRGLRTHDELPAAILEEVLLPGARLQEEPRFLFSQEGRIRDPSAYLSVMTAIAAGLTESNEIAQRVGVDSRNIRHHLNWLEEMELIERTFPVTRALPGKSVQWRIRDPYLRFWFRYVGPNASRLVSADRARKHLDETVLPGLDEFTSLEFEEVCRQWVRGTGEEVARVGRWWGSIKVRRGERPVNVRHEADVAAVDAEGQVTVLGSCKWTAKPHGVEELGKLRAIQRAVGAEGADGASLLFFSREGFDHGLREAADTDPTIELVSLDRLLQDADRIRTRPTLPEGSPTAAELIREDRER